MRTHKKTIIIIHGAGPRHYRSLEDGSGDWQSTLAAELVADYKVLSPQMPSPTKPVYEEWKILFEKYLARAKGDVILVGHSLGGSLLLRYLAEERISQKVAGLFLVAVPLNTMRGFEAPKDYSKLSLIKNVFLYHSMDDVEVPYAHSLVYRLRLKATLKTYSDQGHYFKRKKFDDIVNDIRMISEERTILQAVP